jgi:hypothetical protein
MGGNQSTGRSGGNDNSFKGPDGARTYGTIGRSGVSSSTIEPSGVSYPSGGHHDGGNNYHGSSGSDYNISTKEVASSALSNVTYKYIIEKTTNAAHGNLLSDVRIIDISKSNIKNEDIGVLVQHLQYQGLNLDKFDVSNNLLGYGAVESLFYTFSLSRSNTALYNIKFMNLSNNYIGDDGAKYIASHLSNGQHPNLKALDLSGNQITINGGVLFIEAMEARPYQEIVIKTHDNASSKTTWQFLKQAFNYFADEHHKQSNKAEKAWVALYGDDEWAVCRKFLVETGLIISAGIISKGMSPKTATSLLKVKEYIPKLKITSGIFLQVVKEETKNIFFTSDFMQCLGVINSKSLMDIDDYTKQMIGTTSDDFIFE